MRNINAEAYTAECRNLESHEKLCAAAADNGYKLSVSGQESGKDWSQRLRIILVSRKERLVLDSYVHRHAQKAVDKLSGMFGAVLVAGPRQAGKTTMLKQITEGMRYVTLDDMLIRAEAESVTFFKIIRRRYLWTKYKKRMRYFLRSKC